MHKIQRTHATQETTSHNPDTDHSDQYETQSNQTLHTHNTKAQKRKHTRRRNYNPYVQYRNAPQQNMNANSCLIFT